MTLPGIGYSQIVRNVRVGVWRHDTQITQKDTLVIVATLVFLLVKLIFINNILITKIDTLSENNLRVFFVMPTTASAFLFNST